MRTIAHTVAAGLVFAGAAVAQSFNVDVGGGGSPLPSNGFGGAALQPGVWNAKDPALGDTPTALVGLTGTVTTVMIARTSGLGSQFNFDNPATTGDDANLLDDAEYPALGFNTSWTISGLAAGTYWVYTYAWAPDDAAFMSSISVNGGSGTCVGGAWSGSYTLGVTHAFDEVVVASGGSIVIAFAICASYATFNGIQVRRLGGGAVGTGECFGTTAAFCPCTAAGGTGIANPGASGNGCANSAFAAGARLSASGSALANANDTLLFTCTNVPGPGMLFQSNTTGSQPNFNDGRLCASVGLVRLGVDFPTANVLAFPGGTAPAPIHVAGAPVLTPNPTKHYQCWYRDITPGFCNPAGHNLSNGVAIVWAP